MTEADAPTCFSDDTDTSIDKIANEKLDMPSDTPPTMPGETSPYIDSGNSTLMSRWYLREPVLARATLVVLFLVPFLLIAASVDDRTVNGVNVWLKPIKFNIAIVLYLGTLIWFSGWINRSVKTRRVYKGCTYVLGGTLFILLPWLYGAALIGEPAHYNREHVILAPMYPVIGIVSTVFTAGTLLYAALIAFNSHSPLGTYFRHAVVWSLCIGFIFTVVIAGELASMNSHWIGGSETDKNGMWLFGWSRDGGDLRVAHFFALHAIQLIPLVALIPLPKFLTTWPRLAAASLSIVYCAFVLFVYFQAKSGQPFLPGLG